MDRWAPIIRGSDVSLFCNFGISDTKGNVNGGCIVKLRITTALKSFHVFVQEIFHLSGRIRPGLGHLGRRESRDIFQVENVLLSYGFPCLYSQTESFVV